MSISVTIGSSEFRQEVRDWMGDLNGSIVPDNTIDQAKKRKSIPYLEDKGVDGSSTKIDTAVIALTAEKAFKSWLSKRQMTSGGMNVTINASAYKKDLEKETQEALARVGVEYKASKSATSFVDSTDGIL